MASNRRQRPQAATPTHLTWPSSADIDETLRQRFVADITAAAVNGDVVLVHPKARSKSGRAELSGLLRQWGLAPATAAVLGWDTMNPTAVVPPPPRVSAPPLHTDADTLDDLVA